MEPDWATGGTSGQDHAGVGPELARVLAEEMVALAVRGEQLVLDLGSDPGTVRLHMASLQAVDAVGQTLHAIADILRSANPVEDRLSAIKIDALRDSLTERLAIRMT